MPKHSTEKKIVFGFGPEKSIGHTQFREQWEIPIFMSLLSVDIGLCKKGLALFLLLLLLLYTVQCVTSMVFGPEDEFKYVLIDICWQIRIWIYLCWHFLANTNPNIFGSHFLEKYQYEYFWVYQNWANMITNTVIWTDIFKSE